MKFFNAFRKKKTEKPKSISYEVDIQPDITIEELARIVFTGLRFRSDFDRNWFYNSLPPGSQRHIKKL
jgi:hypothetical protein